VFSSASSLKLPLPLSLARYKSQDTSQTIILLDDAARNASGITRRTSAAFNPGRYAWRRHLGYCAENVTQVGRSVGKAARAPAGPPWRSCDCGSRHSTSRHADNGHASIGSVPGARNATAHKNTCDRRPVDCPRDGLTECFRCSGKPLNKTSLLYPPVHCTLF